MSEQLFLRLRDETDVCSWIVVDADGRLLQGVRHGGLTEVAGDAVARRVTVLVPGLDVVTTKATLPAASQSRLRQLLPFSLEDTLADDVERLAFAIGPKLGSGAHQVSIVAKERLEGWLARIESAGLSAQAIYADTDGVPDVPSTLTVIIEDETVYGRRPDEAALALAGLTLTQAFDALVTGTDGEPSVQHAIVYIDAATREHTEAEVAAIASRLSSLDVKLMQAGPLPAFAAKLAHRPGTNLLQGRYAPKSDWGRLVRPWRLAASLLVALIATTLVANAADYLSLRRQDAALTEVVTARCTTQLSSDRLNQCQTQLQALLRSVGQGSDSGGGFLETLATLAEHLTEANRFEMISYRNGALSAQLVATDVASLDELERFVDAGGRFDMGILSSTPRDGGGIEARIQVEEIEP